MPSTSTISEDEERFGRQIAEALQGTCALKPVSQFCEELGIEETDGLCRVIDAEVFECDECGWWCERCEESDARLGVCDDCQPGEEEED